MAQETPYAFGGGCGQKKNDDTFFTLEISPELFLPSDDPQWLTLNNYNPLRIRRKTIPFSLVNHGTG